MTTKRYRARLAFMVCIAAVVSSGPTAAVAAEDFTCATPAVHPGLEVVGGDPSDCSFTSNVPSPVYEPGELLTIQVVVHVIMSSDCVDGVVSDELVHSQIEILNEDFQALAGSPGENGTDSRIQFELATFDPSGSPTDGITRDCNDLWYADQGNYWETLSWDPLRYLNLYTNTANNARGYVPFLPAQDGGGQVGAIHDRVVVNWLVFGRDGAFPPHDQGRTATHEVGHFLGLFHPYFGGCGIATPPDCYSTGDLICDTVPDETSHDKCPVGAMSCGGFDVPIENYMELTDDLCMEGFTFEQAQRMRCTLEHYRLDLVAFGGIFRDGLESGDTSSWSSTSPP